MTKSGKTQNRGPLKSVRIRQTWINTSFDRLGCPRQPSQHCRPEFQVEKANLIGIGEALEERVRRFAFLFRS